MKLLFHTNLDEAQRDVDQLNAKVWGSYNPLSDQCHTNFSKIPVPRVGDLVRFEFNEFNRYDTGCEVRFAFDLRVVMVVHNYATNSVNVELHIPDNRSISEWTKWFNKHRHTR